MNTLRLSAVLIAVLLIFPTAGSAEDSALQFPPKEFSLKVRFEIGKKFFDAIERPAVPAGGKKPIYPQFLLVEIEGGEKPARIQASPCRVDDPTKMIPGSEPAGFIPLSDHQRIFDGSFQAFSEFASRQRNPGDFVDNGALSVTADVSVNRKSVKLEYDNIQPGNQLPPKMTDLVALIRRYLPETCDPLLAKLKVPELPPLPPEELAQTAKCTVHDEWMKLGKVKVLHGLPLPPAEGYLEAKSKEFPNSSESITGGCIMSGGPEEQEVLYCESCRTARKAWFLKQKERKDAAKKAEKKSSLSK